MKNAAVKQTDKKTVVLTTSAQTAGVEYTVKESGEVVGKFTGISAVIPTSVKFVERSQQGVLGQEVTVKAEVTVADGQSKAGIPVTFNVTGTGSLNTPQLFEATTDDKGVATYTYTRYANTTDDVVAYATGDRTKFSSGKVYWAAAKQLTIKDITEATTITNGGKKVYEINSTNFKGGYVFVAFKGNLNVTPDKVVKGVTAEGNTVHTLGTTALGSGVPGTALVANKYPYKSSLGSEQVIAVKLDANGKANLVLTGANASAIPVVYEGNLLSTATNAHTTLSNYDARYNDLEVQAVGSEVKFDRVVKYGLTLKAEGVRDAALSNADGTGGRDYVATYTKEDGKPVSVGTVVYVAIPRVGLSGTFQLLNEDGDVVPQAAGTDANYYVYALTTDKDGKALFTVTSTKAEDYVQPITFVNDNRTGTTTFFDKDDTQATDDYTYFTNVVNYAAGLKLVTDAGKKQASFSLSEAANFTFSLVDQNGKTRKANKNTEVTFNVSNGEGQVRVNGTLVHAHETTQVTSNLAVGATSVKVRVVAASPTNVSVYATTSQSGETFLPTETLSATFTQYASVTGITGHTNASLLDKVNKTFDLVTSDGKVYTYSYNASNIRLNNSSIDVASFEAELSKGAKVTVAKDTDGNIYYNIVETSVTVPTQATINKLIADGATTIDNNAILAAGGTAVSSTGSYTVNYNGTAALSINLNVKDLSITAPNVANISLAGTYTNVDVLADAATVTSTATIGTLTINGVETHSFINNGTITNVVIKDTTGSRFENGTGSVTGTITVDTTAPVVLEGSIPAVHVASNTANITAPTATPITAVNPAGVVAKDENGDLITVTSKEDVEAGIALEAAKTSLDKAITAAEKVDTTKSTNAAKLAVFNGELVKAKDAYADAKATVASLNAAEKALTDAQKALVLDTVAPTITNVLVNIEGSEAVSVTPVDGNIAVVVPDQSVTTSVVVTFDEAIKLPEVFNIQVKVGENAAVTYGTTSLSSDGKTLTITPADGTKTASVANGVSTITFTGDVTDLVGNVFAGGKFTVEAVETTL